MSENHISAPSVKTIRKIELQELHPDKGNGASLLDKDMQLIQGVKVRLAVSVGACELTIQDLFSLKEDSMLRLDKDMSEPVDVFLDDKLIARGNLVAVDDDFGVKITEIIRSV